MNSEESIKRLEKLNKRVNEIFGIEKTEHINTENKIRGIRFNLSKKNENSNCTILLLLELLNLYIVPAFVLPNAQKSKTTEVVSIKMGDHEKKPIATTIKRYIKQNNTYIESNQLEQQINSEGFCQKIKNFIQNSLNEKEEIEFTGINKDNLNLQISDSENTAVEVTFTASEINTQHIESILNCTSNFRKLINNSAIKSLIEIDYNHSTVESQDKLNIYPFFAKKTVKKKQEIILSLITNQNNVELVSGIFRDSKEQLEIKCGGNKCSLLSYSLDNPFSQHLVDFLLFFNDPSYNGDAKISNLQTIEKIFSEEIEIKDTQKSEEKNSKVKIKIENVTCFTSYLHYEDGCLKLKKSNSGEKIYFNFEVKIENCLDQIKKEPEYIYDTTIYKIVSLISFFALCFNKNEFSISAAVDGKNIFSIKVSLYSELVTPIYEKLKGYTKPLIKPEDYTNLKPQHVQVLDLLCTKKVNFKLEAETQKIAINRLENIEHLMSSISILNSCRKEFLDNIDSPSVGCYLSDFLHTNNNLSCVYVITYQEDLSLGINFLQNELQKSFSRISNSLKQIEKGDKLLSYSMDIDISKSLAHDTNKSQKEEIVEITKVTEEEVKTESQKCIEIEYDVDWKKECFDKIKPTDNYTSLELGLKEAHKFVAEEYYTFASNF